MNTSPVPPQNQKLGAIQSYITQIAPFLLPALFVESGLFLVLSPLPLLLLTLNNRFWMSLLALLTNAAILFAIQGKAPLPLALWLWVIIGLFFPYLIKRLGRVIPAFWISFALGLSVAYVTLSVVSLQENKGVVEFVKSRVSQNIDAILKIPENPLQKIVDDQGRTEVQNQIVTEIPSAMIILYLVVFWGNLLFTSRLMKGFLSKTFWSTYKNPDWLVWPTLVCGTAAYFGHMAIYYIGLNTFKFLMALYALQGLSIISFLLNKYQIQGFGRLLIFLTAVLIAMPLVLVIGFFDQWFDFRRKFGQSL